MIQLDEFTASWLKDLTEAVKVLISCELIRLKAISTVRTKHEKDTIEKFNELVPKLSKYKVEEVKTENGES